MVKPKYLLREIKELGPRRTLFRVGWELRTRTGLAGRVGHWRAKFRRPGEIRFARRLQLAPPEAVAEVLTPLVSSADIDALVQTAERATEGKIRCFSRWEADFGNPIDWYLNPVSGQRWQEGVWWSRAIRGGSRVGDVKYTWEAARFPQAYHMARAAAFRPELREGLAQAFLEQVRSFREKNPRPYGLHWNSGQEVAFRLLSWLFAAHGLVDSDEFDRELAEALWEAASHVEDHIDYARRAVYNNHLISEALLLYAAGTLLRAGPEVSRWEQLGHSLLCEAAEKQFYRDGGYIQMSHTYQRVALQGLLWAVLLARSAGANAPESWLDALDRSASFLAAQQNPEDGRLPNYGANDGALPSVLSTCDYGDFRPIVQTITLLTQGHRSYPPGPWDEEAAWFLGVEALKAPLRPLRHGSKSFTDSGFHVLRSQVDPGTYSVFRCGTLKERFSQMDMLHLDLWWKGLNIAQDAGTYQYNGDPAWHSHFMGTAVHNTVTVDRLDQMVHVRKFKTLYPTEAELTQFKSARYASTVGGRHFGFRSSGLDVTHERTVSQHAVGGWLVEDRLSGPAVPQRIRVHWLLPDCPYDFSVDDGSITLRTERGPLLVKLWAHGKTTRPEITIVRGSTSPCRGWVSRYYGQKSPALSVAVEATCDGSGSLFSSFADPSTPNEDTLRAHAEQFRGHLARGTS